MFVRMPRQASSHPGWPQTGLYRVLLQGLFFLKLQVQMQELSMLDVNFGFYVNIHLYTPYSMNSLFSELFKKFGGVFVDVFETI